MISIHQAIKFKNAILPIIKNVLFGDGGIEFPSKIKKTQ